MINKYKLYGIVGTGAVAFTLFTGMIGFTAGKNLTKSLDQKTIDVRVKKELKKEEKKLEAKTLNNKKVEAFLIQYFTKEKLGANYSRLADFMTDTALKSEKEKDEKPERQVTKDYEINYKFQRADIYIDSDRLVALADVTYTVDNKVDGGGNSQAKPSTAGNSRSKLVKVSYRLENDRLLVTDVELRDTTLNQFLTTQASQN